MSDDPVRVEESSGRADDGGRDESRGLPDDGGDSDVWRYLRLGAIGLLALLAVISTVQLYTNASTAIARWVAPHYVPVFQAAFNLVVLLLALAGLAVMVRNR